MPKNAGEEVTVMVDELRALADALYGDEHGINFTAHGLLTDLLAKAGLAREYKGQIDATDNYFYFGDEKKIKHHSPY